MRLLIETTDGRIHQLDEVYNFRVRDDLLIVTTEVRYQAEYRDQFFPLVNIVTFMEVR